MSDHSKIEWCDASWNPVTGCTKVSSGCDNCYAETLAERFRGIRGHHFEPGFDLTLRPDLLDLPFRWQRPRRIFVNSMSDLFHAQVPTEYVAQVFAVMAAARRHTFLVLTKRPARMRSLLRSDVFWQQVKTAAKAMNLERLIQDAHPLPNVWLLVSAENQKWAGIRIPILLDTPAAVRGVSLEPLLGPVGLRPGEWLPPVGGGPKVNLARPWEQPGPVLDWVITGGETGARARPIHPDWARSIRDECTASGVPFFFKQWGAHRWVAGSRYDEATQCWVDHGIVPQRVPKSLSGCELDGRTWDQFPRTGGRAAA